MKRNNNQHHHRNAILTKYYGKLYKKIGLSGINKFLETNYQLKEEEIENLNRLITSKEIESVIKKLPTNKSPVWSFDQMA